MKVAPWIGCSLRWILAAIFLWAGAAKFGESRVFAAEIARLQLAPFVWSEWIASILPVAELLTGLWLLSAWRTRAAALAVMVLSGVFALAATQAIWRGLDLNCACFGPSAAPPPPAFVLARAILIGLGAAILRRACGLMLSDGRTRAKNLDAALARRANGFGRGPSGNPGREGRGRRDQGGVSPEWP